ncbi:MAG: dTDP-4-dehydrorhamnose 3,5-epimerase [Planctomycetaceae bacterium]
MEVHHTPLPGVLVIVPRVFEDPRGFFLETWQRRRFSDDGIDIDFVQDNWSRSARGTLRGLHYQLQHPQSKLVQVVRGTVFDVAVDLRRDSPAFGQSYCVELSAENHQQLLIPAGCAHGFLVTSESADFQYKCSDIYHPDSEQTLLWNDPELEIDWPLDGDPVVSDKDRQGLRLADAPCYATSPVTDEGAGGDG